MLAVVTLPDTPDAPAVAETGFHFFLDGIRDPGNMGAILRIADWFGFPAVFCSPDCVDVFSPKVVQASMGAFLRVRSQESSLEDLLKKTPGIPVLGAVMHGDNLFGGGWPRGGLVVIVQNRSMPPWRQVLSPHFWSWAIHELSLNLRVFLRWSSIFPFLGE